LQGRFAWRTAAFLHTGATPCRYTGACLREQVLADLSAGLFFLPGIGPMPRLTTMSTVFNFTFVPWFRSVAPYIHKFRHQTLWWD
jgi:hypothetical protein